MNLCLAKIHAKTLYHDPRLPPQAGDGARSEATGKDHLASCHSLDPMSQIVDPRDQACLGVYLPLLSLPPALAGSLGAELCGGIVPCGQAAGRGQPRDRK